MAKANCYMHMTTHSVAHANGLYKYWVALNKPLFMATDLLCVILQDTSSGTAQNIKESQQNRLWKCPQIHPLTLGTSKSSTFQFSCYVVRTNIRFQPWLTVQVFLNTQWSLIQKTVKVQPNWTLVMTTYWEKNTSALHPINLYCYWECKDHLQYIRSGVRDHSWASWRPHSIFLHPQGIHGLTTGCKFTAN